MATNQATQSQAQTEHQVSGKQLMPIDQESRIKPADRLPNCNTNSLDSERAWIFHRNREQPQPDPKEHPLEQIKFYLDRYKIKEALQIFFDANTLKLLHAETDFMWELIPLICGRLRGLCQYRFRVFEGCERMLWRIAIDEKCNPKEVLIVLLAQITQQDNNNDDNVFKAMIRPLEGTLFRMGQPTSRSGNYKWVLSVLMRHINSIDVPQELDLEGRKRFDISSDPRIKRFIDILPLILNFIEEFSDRPTKSDKFPIEILTRARLKDYLNEKFVDEFTMDAKIEDDNDNQDIGDYDDDGDDNSLKDYLTSNSDTLSASITALSSLMARPLAFLDLTQTCPDLRLLSNKCLFNLLKIHPNLFAPIYRHQCESPIHLSPEEFSTDEARDTYFTETTISLAVASYLYRCERVVSIDTEQSYPQVITHEFSLISHIPYIVSLLERSEALIHEKGLLLLESLLLPVSHNSLGQRFLDLFNKSTLSKQIFQIMIFSSMSASRRKAYELFGRVCDLLEYNCKLQVLRSVLEQPDLRPCARAASIDQYRKYLTNIYRELMILNHHLANLDSEENELELVESPPAPEDANLRPEESHEYLAATIQLDNSLNSSQYAHILMEPAKIDKRIRELNSIYATIAGPVLVQFLEICVKSCLPESQHTDIIENYELLLATLTMLRFLKLRKSLVDDKNEEAYLQGDNLSRTFFEPVRSAIGLVRAELKSHQEKDELECLNFVLCRLDLLESVLSRTSDLYGC